MPYEKRLHELGDGTYAYLQPDGGWGWSNAGLVSSGDTSLLVDTLFDLHLTQEMLDSMKAITDTSPIDAAVNTLIWSNLHDDWARRAALVSWREAGRLEATDQRLIAKKRRQLVDLVEAVVEQGVTDGDMRTDDPALAASAIVTLCISSVDPFAEKPPTMAKVIADTQRLARTITVLP